MMIPKGLQDSAIARIREKVSAWISIHATKNGQFDGDRIVDLANFIAEDCAGDVADCAAFFSDWGVHPEQPNVLVYGTPGKGDMDPDVYVIGWRPCDSEDCRKGLVAEGTSIHDHGNSKVAVRVVRGQVAETIFHTNNGSKGPFTVNSRVLSEGETIVIDAPAIHEVHDAPGGVTALTVHVYFPPLEKQTSYTVRDGILVASGGWEDVVESS